MIPAALIRILYDAAAMQRWNEYPRMVELTELDKQAHKFVIAYFLAGFEEGEVDQARLIEAGIFEFLRRVIVTDIRPDVFREVVREKGAELNGWVLEQLHPALGAMEGGAFLERMREYLAGGGVGARERHLLAAAHYLATRWEFQIVYQSSRFLADAEQLRESVEAELARYKDVKGVVEYCFGGGLAKLVDLNGRLRFQVRWAQTPRLPKTTVLGHALIVALLTYFHSRAVGACPQRLAKTFWCALFHDLPEALTRDIVSPVKRSVAGLDALIQEVEIQRVREKILPLAPARLQPEFAYLLGLYPKPGGGWRKDEFEERIWRDGRAEAVDDAGAYNENGFGAVDGRAVKACDDLAAFTEAAISINHGITSSELVSGKVKIKAKYQHAKPVGGCDWHALLTELETALAAP